MDELKCTTHTLLAMGTDVLNKERKISTLEIDSSILPSNIKIKLVLTTLDRLKNAVTSKTDRSSTKLLLSSKL